MDSSGYLTDSCLKNFSYTEEKEHKLQNRIYVIDVEFIYFCIPNSIATGNLSNKIGREICSSGIYNPPEYALLSTQFWVAYIWINPKLDAKS